MGRLELQRRHDALTRLRAQMWDETTFIVRKDGLFGILFEVEYCSQESEVDRKEDDPEWFGGLKPHQLVISSVTAALTDLMPSYPGVLFGVPDEEEVVHNRPAAWAFVPDGLLSDEQREALGMSLLSS